MNYQLTLGDGVAVLHSRGRSSAIVAKILGDETDDQGVRRIWLDRRVHVPDDALDGDWRFEGAVSSVLVRIVPTEKDSP